MKDFSVSLLLPFLLLTLIPQLHAAELKVGSVDVAKIFSGWKVASKKEKELEQAREKLEKENDERLTVIKSYQAKRNDIYQDYQGGEKSITAEEKAKLDLQFMNLGREAIALDQDRKEFYRKAKRKLELDFANESKEMLAKIAEEVQKYAKANKYDMVIDMGETTNELPMFVRLDKARDISDVIIKRLNRAK